MRKVVAGQARRPVSSSFSGTGIGDKGWISPLCSERCFFPLLFSLRVGGSENVYTEGGEEQGLRAVSESTAWTFATFPRIREVLKLKCLLAEYQRLVNPPLQLCRRILRYLLFN